MKIRMVIDAGKGNNRGFLDVENLLREYKYYDPIEPAKPNSYMAREIKWHKFTCTIIATDYFVTMIDKLIKMVATGQIKSVRIDQGARTQ